LEYSVPLTFSLALHYLPFFLGDLTNLTISSPFSNLFISSLYLILHMLLYSEDILNTNQNVRCRETSSKTLV
jgi:hypothetical protein